jgi:hypothetical protein
MSRNIGQIVTLITLLVLAGCASDEREWMKLSEKYTIAEFRRDHAACSKAGKLDDACMRERGWVAVSPSGTPETPKDPLARDIGGGSRRGY